MMVVVADSILEARRRPGGLNASNQTSGDEHAEGVVHRLQRNRANLDSDRFGHAVGRDVRLAGDGAQDGQSLCRDLNATFTQDFGGILHAR